MRRFVLLLVLTVSAALANIAPQALEQRSRLGFLLSDSTRSRADRVAAELALTDLPPQMEARLAEALGEGGQTEPVRLYAGVTFLKRRDLALEGYERRLGDARLAQELLEEYLDQAGYMLAYAGSGPAGEALPPPAQPPWELEESVTALKVARWLPYPTSSMSRAQVAALRAAADTDLKAAYAEYDRVEKARDAYRLSSLPWVDYVFSLTNSVGAMKDRQILALPGANPHPPPTF